MPFRRLRIYFYGVIILLAGFIYVAFDAIMANTRAQIAAANNFILRQEFKEADSVLNNRNLFSRLNFYYTDDLKRIGDTVRKEMAIQNVYIENTQKGDSLLGLSSASLIAIDSLFNIADSLKHHHLETSANFETIGKEIKKLLDWSGLKKARQYYIKAQQTGYIPNNSEIGAGSKLAQIDEMLSTSFNQCINATYLLRKAKDKEGAEMAFKKTNNLYSFATDTTNNIMLSPVDIPYLDSLKKDLEHGK